MKKKVNIKKMNQQKLFKKTNEDKRGKLSSLLNEFMQDNHYSKIIKYFGNLNSKTLILGESPVQNHVSNPKSQCCFCFDINSTEVVDNLSGSVLIKVFKELGLSIKDYFWANVYQLPIESLSKEEKELHEKLLINIINTLDISRIIVLGRNAESVIKRLDLDITVDFIYHPGYCVRNSNYYSRYKMMWESLKLK